MARIAGVDLPNDKRVEIGLTYIYGIGRPTANDILSKAGINPDDYYKMDLDERLRLMRQLDNQELISNGIVPDQFRNLSMNEQAKIYEQIRTKAQE